MPGFCYGYPQYMPGEKVVSLVEHPPEIKSGTKATIISPQVGTLYAVKLPNGELHRWFAGFEMQNMNPGLSGVPFRVGDMARIVSNQGHPPMIQKGMIVQIVKIIEQTPFYDLRLDNGMYHRWLAEFEITRPL